MIARDTDRDFILTAEEARSYGVVDEVISKRALAVAPTASQRTVP